MANEQNLKPLNKRTKSEQRKIAQKGGKASGKTRQRKKEMRERLAILLSMALNDGKETDIEKIKSFESLEDENITVEDAILITVIKKALKGDLSAVTFLRDTSGQKCVEKVEISQSVDDSIKEIEQYMKGK